jgi:hypothetical protein
MERLDATPEELDSIVERTRPALDEPDYRKLKAAIRTLGAVNTLIQNQDITIESLRNFLCGSQTEKTTAVLKRSGINTGLPPKAPNHPATAGMVRRPIVERTRSRFPTPF